MSLLLVVHDRRKTIVATDSRGMIGTGGFRDGYQKLFKCSSRSICGTVGFLGSEGEFDVADGIGALCERPDLQEKPLALLESIRGSLLAPLSTLTSAHLKCDSGIIFSAAVLQRAVTGEITFQELRFPVSETVAGWTLLPESITTHFEGVQVPAFRFAAGWASDITHQMADQLSPDTCTDWALTNRIEEIFRATRQTEFGCEVGEAADIACLDDSGLRWLRQQPLDTKVAAIAAS